MVLSPQVIINGIITGSIIALAGIGLSMVYGILRFPNFAHGSYLSLGAYVALFFNVTLGLHIVFSLIMAMIITVLCGVLIYQGIFKRMKKAVTSLLVVSVGVGMAVENTVLFIWGGSLRCYNLEVQRPINIFGIRITQNSLLMIVLAFLLMFMVHYLLKYTKIGKAMRAMSDNVDLARVIGIDTERITLSAWILGLALAGASGVFAGMDTFLRPGMGTSILLSVFSGVVLGGIGSIYGAMAGSMIIGLSQELSVAFFPSTYKLAVAFVIMIMTLLLKPSGIFGGRT